MSEIRLADDDKDKKYRIRINEDGEEELEYIEPEPEAETPEEYLDFQTYVDEDTEVTEEETAELMRAAREEQARLAREEAQGYIAKAKERIQNGETEYALVALDAAQKAWDEEWEIYTLKLQLLTNYFTDFSRIDECLTLADGYEKFVPEEVKEQFKADYAANINARLDEQQKNADSIKVENEAKKADRRVRFKANRNRSLRNFLFAFVPFLIVLGVAIGFSPSMFSDKTGTMLVVTIVLFSVSAVILIVSLVLLKPLLRDARRVRLNERDSSTAIGRSYIESSSKAEDLKELYEMLTKPYDGKPEYASAIDGEVNEI